MLYEVITFLVPAVHTGNRVRVRRSDGVLPGAGKTVPPDVVAVFVVIRETLGVERMDPLDIFEFARFAVHLHFGRRNTEAVQARRTVSYNFV